MNTPPPDLERFLSAQSIDFETALAELKRGRKESHWIWHVLPQHRGLGLSPRAVKYGIPSLAEARAYLEHPVLGARLRECVTTIRGHTGASAVEILGDIDAVKFRSCLTLFAAASPDPGFFQGALRQFFDGSPDPETLRLLAEPDSGA